MNTRKTLEKILKMIESGKCDLQEDEYEAEQGSVLS